MKELQKEAESDELIFLRDRRDEKIRTKISSLTANAFAEIETTSSSQESSTPNIVITEIQILYY